MQWDVPVQMTLKNRGEETVRNSVGLFFGFFLAGFGCGSFLTNVVNDFESLGAKVVLIDEAIEAFDFWALTKLLQRGRDCWCITIVTGFFLTSHRVSLEIGSQFSINGNWVKLCFWGDFGAFPA